jgi:hypothetical protein
MMDKVQKYNSFNTLNMCSFLNVRIQISHPDRTGKIVVLYFNLQVFRDEV